MDWTTVVAVYEKLSGFVLKVERKRRIKNGNNNIFGPTSLN
jgi:hypothetical protein